MLQVKEVPLDSISLNIDFTRTQYDPQKYQDLVTSIRQMGIIYPLITMETPEGYILIAGYRRYNAAKEIGLPSVPCYCLKVGMDDAEILRLHENIFREDVSPIQEAIQLSRLEQTYHFTREKIAKLTGKSKGYVTQRIQILSWPQPLQEAVANGSVSYSVARELSMVTEGSELLRLLDMCVTGGATVRTVLSWVNQWKADEAERHLLLSKPNQSAPPDETDQPSLKCYLCSAELLQSGVVIIHLCPGCAEQINLYMFESP